MGEASQWLRAVIAPSVGVKRALVGLASALTIAGAAIATPKPNTEGLVTGPIDVAARPITAFDRADQSKTTFGKLTWLGGIELTSAKREFGGWSGLVIDADGQAFMAVSDAGTWMSGKIAYTQAAPTGLRDVQFGAVLAKDGTELGRRYRDAEALTLTSGTVADGSFLISFEGKARIAHITSKGGQLQLPTTSLELPADHAQAKNDGFEAVTQLKGGALAGQTVAIVEGQLNVDGHHPGWIWSVGAPQAFALTDIGGFSITDIAATPDGGMLVLERRYRPTEGVKMRVRRVPASEIKPGAVIHGEILLEADGQQEIDNMEGLALHRTADGQTVLTIISDDNFRRGLQRTILLQFVLAEDGQQALQ